MADIRIIRGQRIVPDVEQALQFAGYESKGAAWERAEGMCRDMAPLLRRSLQAKAVLAFTEERLYVILTLGAAVSRQIDAIRMTGMSWPPLLFAAMADTCLFALEQQVLQQLRLICRQKGCGIVCRHEPGSDLPYRSRPMRSVRRLPAGGWRDGQCGHGFVAGEIHEPRL